MIVLHIFRTAKQAKAPLIITLEMHRVITFLGLQSKRKLEALLRTRR